MLSGILLGPQDKVFKHRHVAKLVRNLPGLREAKVNDFVGREAIDSRVVEPYATVVGAVQPSDDVEEGRLPRPVRPDESRHRLRRDGQRTSVDGPDPSKGFVDA